MDKFWELLERSVIIQSVVTLLLVVTVCVMAIRQWEVPDLIKTLTIAVVTFWMGSKVQNEANREAIRRAADSRPEPE